MWRWAEKNEGGISAPSETCKDIETICHEAASMCMTDTFPIVASKTKKIRPKKAVNFSANHSWPGLPDGGSSRLNLS